MNHVLMGGPVANELVASLVTLGTSKVTWETSDGDIEVIADAPASGFSSSTGSSALEGSGLLIPFFIFLTF